ncbi:hypothetical protein PTQ35_07595 [Campylobacter sp. 46490-21]|uniref:hypothetical protein n=1 Tax=Campylobacter magnus TaxID=3026462 RepID=UPI002360D009|nr:hypothetical protein [Campylobacter magnus]MDD0848657.1 hypothetical protein [Campylobacter magnus]
MRDYDKEPLIMKTEQFHLFLFEFVCCLIGIFIIYIALEDAFGERKTHYPMAGVAIGLIMIFMSIRSIIKVKKSPKLFTKIYNDKIIRDYIYEDNKVKIWEIKIHIKLPGILNLFGPKKKLKMEKIFFIMLLG